MASCHEMKEGQIYVCEDCGIELKVIKECKNSDKPAADCGCHGDEESGGFFCCGKGIKLKEQ